MAMVMSRSLILILAVHLPAAIHHATNGNLLYRIYCYSYVAITGKCSDL